MRHILLANANKLSSIALRAALRGLGDCEAALATSTPQAQQLCEEIKPDLAVIDLDLPDCALPELIRQLRTAVPGLPVVLMARRPQDVPAGVIIQGLIIKPASPTDLTAVVNRVLQAPASPAAAKPAPLPTVKLTEDERRLLAGHVEALSHMLQNEPALLAYGARAVTVAPQLSHSASAALAQTVNKVMQAHRAGDNPGAEVLRFEGNSEISHYMLYCWAVAGEWVLAVALSKRLPLPAVRQSVRETAEELAAIIKTKDN